MNEEGPNTDLFCNKCGKNIGRVCMLSPDWSALESFRNLTRNHFEQEHGMKPQEGTDRAIIQPNMEGVKQLE